MVARLFEKGSASNKALSVIVSFLLVFSLLSLSLAGAPEAFADEGVAQQAAEGAASEGVDAPSEGSEALDVASPADQPDQSLQSPSVSEASGGSRHRPPLRRRPPRQSRLPRRSLPRPPLLPAPSRCPLLPPRRRSPILRSRSSSSTLPMPSFPIPRRSTSATRLRSLP